MTTAERYETWWAGLTDAERAEVLGTPGEVTAHIADSLRAAGIVVIRAELGDGDAQRTAFLLPALVADFIESIRGESGPSQTSRRCH